MAKNRYKYVYLHKGVGKYEVLLRWNKKPLHIGYFATEEEALKQRDIAVAFLEKHSGLKAGRVTTYDRLKSELLQQSRRLADDLKQVESPPPVEEPFYKGNPALDSIISPEEGDDEG